LTRAARDLHRRYEAWHNCAGVDDSEQAGGGHSMAWTRLWLELLRRQRPTHRKATCAASAAMSIELTGCQGGSNLTKWAPLLASQFTIHNSQPHVTDKWGPAPAQIEQRRARRGTAVLCRRPEELPSHHCQWQFKLPAGGRRRRVSKLPAVLLRQAVNRRVLANINHATGDGQAGCAPRHGKHCF
jgi:hypothetical protein